MKECDAPVSNRTVAEKGLTGRMRNHCLARTENRTFAELDISVEQKEGWEGGKQNLQTRHVGGLRRNNKISGTTE